MTSPKPPIVRPTRALPFDQLPWDDFERLCLILLPREGFENPQHYGAAGGEQGRDIVATRDSEPWYVQCKQVKRCGPKVLLDEIKKIQELMEDDPDLRPSGILFMASCDVSATARDRAAKRCKELGLACEIWGRTDLDARVLKSSDIIAMFFGEGEQGRTKIAGDGNVVGDGSIAQVVKIEGTTTGDVVQVAGDYYASAVSLWSSLSGFLGKHWKALLALIIANGSLLFLYPALEAYYMVKPVATATAAVLATLAIVGWVNLANRQWKGTTSWAVSGVTILLLVGLLATQAKQTFWPEKFASQDFGVAVAYFGEGPDCKPGQQGKQTTNDLIEDLTTEIQKPDASLSNVTIKRIGIVKSSDEAKRWGQRLGADLVIWGRFVAGEKGSVTVHFEVLETPASVLNPEYPRILPIGYKYSAEVPGQSAAVRGTHQLEVKEAVFEQSKAVTNFVLGLAYYLERDFQRAIVQFEAAKEALIRENTTLGKDAADPALAHYYLGKSYQMIGRIEDSIGDLEEAAKLNSDDPAAQLSLAYSYRAVGHLSKAEASEQKAVGLCSEILAKDPENEEAWYDLGLAYEMLGEYQQALKVYLKLIEVNPGFHIAHVSAGRIYASQGDYDQAVTMYHLAIEKAKQAGYSGAWTYVDLGDVYLMQGDTESALQVYSLAAQLEPEQDWMHFRLAQFYETEGEIDLAWEEYERVVQVSSNRVWAHAVLGDFLCGQGMFELGIESYNRARMFNPDDAVTYARLGKAFLNKYLSSDGEKRDAEEAERAFSEALRRLPADSGFRFHVFADRGRLYFAQGRFDLALDDFEKALEIDPLSPEIQFSLARAYDAAGDVSNACAAYEQFLAFETDIAEELVEYAQNRIQVLCNH